MKGRTDLSADYLVGLVDGEGCFYVNLSQDKRYPRSRLGVETHFYIKLREDELPLLKKVRDTFRCGAIYLQREKRPNHAQCYRFEVNSRQDISKIIIPFFKKYRLQSQKREDFVLFAKICALIDGDYHRTEKGLTKIQQLKSSMNSRARLVREIRLPSGNAT